MKTSILMSVYNGEKYLQEQLESIINQTLLPNEVVIIDDCSTDNTVQTVRNFIDKYHLENWTVYINKANKGWKRNFMDGIAYTSGDIVFFSDQDDVWIKEKIEIYGRIFSDDPTIDVLISPYIEWYGENIKIPSMRKAYHKLRLNGKYKNFNVTGLGCTLAFRKEFYIAVKQYYVDGWAHDDFFRKMPQIEGRLGMLETPSILRRFHGDNASKAKRTYQSSIIDYKVGMKSIDSMNAYLHTLHDANMHVADIALFKRLKKGYENRLKYFESGKIRYLAKTVLLNPEQYKRLRQILGDFLLVNKNLTRKR